MVAELLEPLVTTSTTNGHMLVAQALDDPRG
jgi:hypothetical protein